VISLFGENKPPELKRLINDINAELDKRLGKLYEPADERLVHGTICGVEGRVNDGQIFNTTMLKRHNVDVKIAPQCGVQSVNIDGFLAYFHQAPWPVTFQIGGIVPNQENPYTSRPPFERMFSIQENGFVVMIGWPLLAPDKSFAPYLLGVRKYFEKFGIVHKYHINPVLQDNDLFIVLGTLNYDEWEKAQRKSDAFEKVFNDQITEAEETVRQYLSSKPAMFEIDKDNTFLVKYHRTSLTEISWCKCIVDVSPKEMRSLY